MEKLGHIGSGSIMCSGYFSINMKQLPNKVVCAAGRLPRTAEQISLGDENKRSYANITQFRLVVFSFVRKRFRSSLLR